jgi:hypothetical protein
MVVHEISIADTLEFSVEVDARVGRHLTQVIVGESKKGMSGSPRFELDSAQQAISFDDSPQIITYDDILGRVWRLWPSESTELKKVKQEAKRVLLLPCEKALAESIDDAVGLSSDMQIVRVMVCIDGMHPREDENRKVSLRFSFTIRRRYLTRRHVSQRRDLLRLLCRMLIRNTDEEDAIACEVGRLGSDCNSSTVNWINSCQSRNFRMLRKAKLCVPCQRSGARNARSRSMSGTNRRLNAFPTPKCAERLLSWSSHRGLSPFPRSASPDRIARKTSACSLDQLLAQ